MSTTAEYFVGLDIGGTTVKTILIDKAGQAVGDLLEVRSHVTEGYRTTFGQLKKAIDRLAEQGGVEPDVIAGVGLDVPAPCCDGVIWSRANLADDWVGVNIRDELSREIGIPVFMTNDGNAAAVGEYAMRPDYSGSLLYVAPGTGLAGGLVLPGGDILEGANGLSMEAGHNSVPFMEDDGSLPQCSCGKHGCTEAWVSLVALRRRLGLELAKEQWADHKLNQEDGPISDKAFQLRTLAQHGDELALSIFKQQGFIFGYALADLVRLLDPGLIVIGGGLAESSPEFREQYLGWIMEGFTDRAWPVYLRSPIDPDRITTHFEWALGGDGAGALGVAFKACELFG